VAVEATGRYLRLPIDHISKGDFGAQWFSDGRPLPEEIS